MRIAETLAELVIPVVPGDTNLLPCACTFTGILIPVHIWWAELIICTLALARHLVPLLGDSTDIVLGTYAATCLKAKHVGGYAHDLLLALANAGNWIPNIRERTVSFNKVARAGC